MTNRLVDRPSLGVAACLGGAALAQNLAASFTGTGTGWVTGAGQPEPRPGDGHHGRSLGLPQLVELGRATVGRCGRTRDLVQRVLPPATQQRQPRDGSSRPRRTARPARRRTSRFRSNSWHHVAGTFDNSAVAALPGRRSGRRRSRIHGSSAQHGRASSRSPPATASPGPATSTTSGSGRSRARSSRSSRP